MAEQPGIDQEPVEEPLLDIITCSSCGHDNPAGTRYCDNCGSSLAKAAKAGVTEPVEEKKKGFFARLLGR